MTDYWHGGVRGIPVGELLLSRHEQGSKASHRTKLMDEAPGYYGGMCDPKRVYFTTDRNVARGWAAEMFIGAGGSSLYRVRPVPPASLEVDPDFPRVGFCARRAEVLEVIEDVVVMEWDDARRAVSGEMHWSDGSPMYDGDGFMLPGPEHRQYGATPADYRHVPRWFTFADQVGLFAGGELRVSRKALALHYDIQAGYEQFHRPLLDHRKQGAHCYPTCSTTEATA